MHIGGAQSHRVSGWTPHSCMVKCYMLRVQK